jgi:hypothetical protein
MSDDPPSERPKSRPSRKQPDPYLLLPRSRKDRDAAIAHGRVCWQSLQQRKTWEAWEGTCVMVYIVRREVMEKLGIAKPEGGKYRNAMNRALFENQIHMGHTTRKACLDCAPHLAAIAEFREVTKIDDPAKHLQLDHPQLVWNAFKRTLADPDTEAKATKRKSSAS